MNQKLIMMNNKNLTNYELESNVNYIIRLGEYP